MANILSLIRTLSVFPRTNKKIGYLSLVSHVKDPVTEAKFLVQDWMIQSTMALTFFYIVLSARQPGRPVRQPFAIVDYIPQSKTKNLVSDVMI